MKTTVVIADALFARAQRASKLRGVTMRELVEEGLRAVLEKPPTPPYKMPDCSVGRVGGVFPLAGRSWADVRADIYGDDE
jgi:Bacterial antitoxin of type II TA system, VapB